MMQSLEFEFPVTLMCRCLKVSRSGYYQWKTRPASSRAQSQEAMTDEIKRVTIRCRYAALTDRILSSNFEWLIRGFDAPLTWKARQSADSAKS